MDAPIAQLARPVIPEPVPVVVESRRIERTLRGRPQPQIVIHMRGGPSVRLSIDGLSSVRGPGLRQLDCSQLAATDEVDGRLEVRNTTLL